VYNCWIFSHVSHNGLDTCFWFDGEDLLKNLLGTINYSLLNNLHNYQRIKFADIISTVIISSQKNKHPDHISKQRADFMNKFLHWTDLTILISESGLYDLLTLVNLERSITFRNWIVSTVLPSLRNQEIYVNRGLFWPKTPSIVQTSAIAPIVSEISQVRDKIKSLYELQLNVLEKYANTMTNFENLHASNIYQNNYISPNTDNDDGDKVKKYYDSKVKINVSNYSQYDCDLSMDDWSSGSCDVYDEILKRSILQRQKQQRRPELLLVKSSLMIEPPAPVQTQSLGQQQIMTLPKLQKEKSQQQKQFQFKKYH